MSLKPLPYHKVISRHLEEKESGLWSWFRSDNFSTRYIESAKLELLKTTYRLPEQGHESIYAIANKARLHLNINLPLTIYQSQGASSSANAALVFFEDELALVLDGNILELLNEDELLALFGHELAHHKLFSMQQGYFFSTARLLDWCCNQPDCPPAYFETYRLYQIYTEIFADMGALSVSENLESSVSCLVKVSTGLKEVSARSYLSQAEEILQQQKSGSEGSSHPEIFLRARVLEIISKSDFLMNNSEANDLEVNTSKDSHSMESKSEGSDLHESISSESNTSESNTDGVDTLQQIRSLVERAIDVKQLDIPAQKYLTNVTRRLIDVFTSEKFLRTEHSEMLAREYFPSFEWCEPVADTKVLTEEILILSDNSKDYLCYVLLDFATVDADGGDVDLAASLIFSEHIGLFDRYEPVARKELKRKKAELAQLKRHASEMIEKANHD